VHPTLRKLDRRRRAVQESLRAGGGLAWERLRTGHAWNPTSARLRQDPYPVYARLREHDPIHRSVPAYGWALFRYDHVLEALRDPRFSADDRNFQHFDRMHRQAIREGLAEADEEPEPTMLRSDPPRHTRLRGLVNKAFTPRAVEKLRPRVEELAEELLDRAESRGRFDVMRDYAIPLPVTVIAEMLGVPAEERDTFKRWSDALVGFLDPLASPGPDVLRQVRDEFFTYVDGIANERRRAPRDDLISALVQAEEAGDRLSGRELHATVALLLAAGNETTTNLIGNGVLALLRQPEEWSRLVSEPKLVDSAVEELVRYDSPVQFTGRVALDDVDFYGARIRRGQNVVLVLASANRDPAVFPEPDRLDVGRENNRHLGFGRGPHFCLGAGLARLEARIALSALLRRFPQLRFAGDDLSAVRWRKLLFLRGLAELPVRV